MLLSSLALRRTRMALALSAVALGVGVSTTLATLALQVGDDLARTLRAAGPNFVALPRGARLPIDVGGVEVEPPRAGLGLRETAVADLKHGFWRNNVLAAAPELTLPATLDDRVVVMAGTWFRRDVDVNGTPWATGFAALHPALHVDGRWPRDGADEIVLGRDLATRLKRSPGEHVSVRRGGATEHWLVTGVLSGDPGAQGRAWTSLERAQSLAGRPGEVDRVWVSALVLPPTNKPAPDRERDPAGYERYLCSPFPNHVASDLAEQLPGAEVLPISELVAGEGAVVGRLNLLMVLLALAALTASVLGLLSTTTASVVERQAEFALLRSLGATPGWIAALLFGENLLVSLGGGALGFLLGAAGAAAIRGRAFGSAAEVPGLLLPIALVLAAALGAVGTLAPLRLALRVDPARALRG